MIKMITILFAALCTIQTYASEQYLYTDTVQCKSHGGSLDILQPLEPTYLDGVLVPAGGSGNWFVTVAGGLNAFLGTPLGCDDLFGRIKPAYSFAVGKWFTPAVGGRINYNGMAFKDGLLSEQKYHHVHADLMWNILGRRYARQEQVRWTVAPFAGVGMIHHATNGNNPFALSYGIQGQYRLSKRISLLVELSGMTTFKNFDGIGRPNRPGDNMLLLTAGLSFSIGKSGWKRVVDAGPYMQMNERLVSRTGSLSAENRYYAGLNDQNSRALAELKKVLEIEGLLDKYSHLFVDGNEQAGRTFPVNNYSGLNSLLARLKNKKWNGKSVEENSNQDTVDSAEDCLFSCNDSVHGLELLEDSAYHCRLAQDSISGIKNTSLFADGTIGSPVYFFFCLNSAQLTDESQSINIDALARVAVKYNLSVRVTGAADEETGTSAINDSLSLKRANYISGQLLQRGVSSGKIIVDSKGGISDYSPQEANRNTKVELLAPDVTGLVSSLGKGF